MRSISSESLPSCCSLSILPSCSLSSLSVTGCTEPSRPLLLYPRIRFSRSRPAAEVFGCAVCPAQPRRRTPLKPSSERQTADSRATAQSRERTADRRHLPGDSPSSKLRRRSETRKGLRRTGRDVEDAAVPCPRRELDMVRDRSGRRKPQLRGAAGARAFEALEASRLQVEHPAPETMLVS